MDDVPSENTAEILRRMLRHPNASHLNTNVFEIAEKRTYLQHGVEVREGDTVLDVGANVGVAAAFFVLECRAGVVHSFEPISPIFEVLRENLAPFPACVTHNYGLSDSSHSGTITFYPNVWAMSGTHADPEADEASLRRALRNLGASEQEAVEGTRDLFTPATVAAEFRTVSEVLRTESIERVDLLKIDVEKAELEVLAGIDGADWQSIRQMSGELHLGEAGRAEFTRTLRDHGFEVAVMQEPFMEGTDVYLFYAVRP